jgi:predicted DNA-binding transcriptional regulator AlpA
LRNLPKIEKIFLNFSLKNIALVLNISLSVFSSKLNNDTLLSDKQMSLVYGFSIKTLQNHRSLRVGIPYIKLGKMVRYRKKDVDEYIELHKVKYND